MGTSADAVGAVIVVRRRLKRLREAHIQWGEKSSKVGCGERYRSWTVKERSPLVKHEGSPVRNPREHEAG